MNPLALTEQAIDRNELSELLMGRGEYYFPNKWAELPNDLTRIFIEGFNVYANKSESNRKILNEKLVQALTSILQNPIGTWWCLSIIYSYLFGYKENSFNFEIDVNNLIDLINQSLKKYKKDLVKNKEWVGYRFENGLWEDIVFIAAKINDKINTHTIICNN
jgi:hypothetical protein